MNAKTRRLVGAIGAVILGAFMFLAAPAVADWDPGDGHKMHFPQLPDPNGWDVSAYNLSSAGIAGSLVADDWQCSQSGPVGDIHIWGSWYGDIGKDDDIIGVHVSIHEDIPVDPGDPDSFSMPGDLLWERDFAAGEFTVRGPFSGQQGWYSPPTQWEANNHNLFHQINIVDIEQPFRQKEGEIYWLDIQVILPATSTAQWGWKTSLNHWNDDAVWFDGTGWQELFDPEDSGHSLDMAFVITPEPGSIALAVTGLVGLLGFGWWRRRRRT